MSSTKDKIVRDRKKNVIDIDSKSTNNKKSTSPSKPGKSLLKINDYFPSWYNNPPPNYIDESSSQSKNSNPIAVVGDTVITKTSSQTLLANMTDDMFVREVPSFVVPYLYEKPPVESLKEIVDELGLKLQETNANSENRKEMQMEVDNICNETATLKKPDKKEIKVEKICDVNKNISNICIDKNNTKLNTKLTAIFNAINNIPSKMAIERFFVNLGQNLIEEFVNKETVMEKISNNKKIFNVINQRDDENRCKVCNYTSESKLVMSHHLDMPHKYKKIKAYFCYVDDDNVVQFKETRIEQSKIEKTTRYWCSYCTVEHCTRQGISKHVIRCFDNFVLQLNLTTPEWETPAKISKFQNNKKISTAGSGIMKPKIKSVENRRRAIGPSKNIVTVKLNATSVNDSKLQPISSVVSQSNDYKPIIKCEICDGFLKGTQLYQVHMNIIHSITFDIEVLSRRPPLNCQKCEKRYFTDIGLERHLLGVHNLVTLTLQEAADNGIDASKCILCGAAQAHILRHMTQVHLKVLKPANLTYKCKKCGAMFYIYSMFERHIIAVHSKKHIDRNTN